jgi:hypothetical protein
MKASFRAVAAVLCALLLALGLIACGGSGHSQSGAAAAGTVLDDVPATGPPAFATVRVDGHAAVRHIPPSFFGLSTEYWTLPQDQPHIALYRRVLSLLHVRGDGRFILRIGGDSASHTFYDPSGLVLPRWAFELTPTFIDQTASIVRRMNLRVILDLNLITGSAPLAASWAKAAEGSFPRRSIIGFEIGNEPDLYDKAFWLYTTGGEQFSGRALPPDITAADYAADFNQYAHALAKTVPHVPLYAPALANPVADISWIATLIGSAHPSLGAISGHRYPYSGCALRGSPQYPTIGRVLGVNANTTMAEKLRPVVQLAASAGLPFRLTEINSITCGGLPGVSNAFATGLWFPDAIFEIMRTGAHGANLHERENAVNDPFAFNANGLVVHPLMYGMILYARTMGPKARLVPVTVRSTASPFLKVWAVASGNSTLRVLLINKGASDVTARLALPATSPATVTRLLAPSPAAQSGVTLGGQYLDGRGHWAGTATHEVVRRGQAGYELHVPRYSAALVSVDGAHAR